MEGSKFAELLNSKKYSISGIPMILFFPFAILIWILAFTGKIGKDAFSTLMFVMTLGMFLQWLGNKTPFLGKYVGFGGILPLFGASLLVTIGLVSPDLKSQCSSFVSGHLTPYLVSILICCAVIGKMDRETLKKAVIRYFPVIIIGQVFAMAGAFICGRLLGYSDFESLVLTAFPCFCGGSGGATTRIPAILNDLGLEGSSFVGFTMTAASLANIEAILLCSVLDAIGKVRPSMTGNGKLIRNMEKNIDAKEQKAEKFNGDFSILVASLFIIGVIVIVSQFLASLIKPLINLNYLVYVVIICIIIKITGVFPKKWEDAISYWQSIAVPIMLPALISGMGIGSIDLVEVVQSLNPSFFILVTVTVVAFVVGSMLGGFLFGMFPVEAGISVGCCSTNIGGTGDIICCETAHRMELYPFAALSTRIGGAIALIELGFIVAFIQIP